jgi:DNA helicase-2/ATP-dependent DNA helicase PcrA
MADLNEIYDADRRVEAIWRHQNGVLDCLGGPGTGKTRAFLQRVKALTASGQVTPDEICYLTFIKEISKAFAADFQAEQEIEPEVVHRPRMSTLHSFACRLIRNQGFRHGFDGQLYFVSVADAQDPRSAVFVGDLLPMVTSVQLKTVPQVRKALESLKRAWRDATEMTSLPQAQQLVLARYNDLARAYRLVDWDLTIPFAHLLYRDLDGPPEWISRLEHLLVDEYQDINRAEQDFIATLSTQAKSVVIIGDDNQSLYRGRGGSPKGLIELYNLTTVDRVSLVRCHRCKSVIVDAANKFLRAMRRDANPLLPEDVGGSVTCHEFKSAKAEIEYLVDFLKSCIAALPPEPRPRDGIVCLFRTRQALSFYQGKLIDGGVRCYSRSATRDPKRDWLKRALELISYPGQRFLERLLLEEFSDVKTADKRKMVELMRTNDASPSEALGVLAPTGRLSSTAESSARVFCELCAMLSKREVGLIARAFAERLDIDQAAAALHLERFLDQLNDPEREQLIDKFCDLLIPESAASPEDPRSVLCLTMHGSKGLTKKTVVMPGLEEALLPGNSQGKEPEETKRLFYVALTRATDQVLISYPRTRARGDPFNFSAPGRGKVSSFVRQAGIRCV